jgi:uncharacterized protein involved in exopolysaccharide biosynthesis/Mrp family chromosome partitioning ATPase
VVVFASVVALTLLAIALYPRSFTSEAKLFLRVGRESVALDPTATTGQTIMLQKTQVDEVNSALQVLLSRDVFQRVVQRIGAERIVQDLPAAKGGAVAVETAPTWIDRISAAKSWVSTQVGGALVSLRLSDPGTPEEMAIRKIDSGLKAYAPKESTVITVSFSAASPQLAQDVVKAVTDVFLDEHLRVNHTEGSLKFFSEQSAALEKQLADAEAVLRDRKNEFQISTIESRRAVFAEQLKDVELQVLATQRELAYSEAEIADLKRAIDSLEPELVTNRVNGFANEGKDVMRGKLYELEIEESKLRSRYQEGHPLLMQIEQQRKEAEEILKGMPDERTQTTAALNPNQRRLELDLLQAKSRKEALEARKVAAQTQQQELNEELKELNNHEVELDQLERNVQISEGKYRMHVEKLEQARVNDALGRDGISNIEVAQAASFVDKPTSPKKALLLALGLVLAMGSALAVPFVAEIFDETLRTTDQVEAVLGLPVVLSFPRRGGRRRKQKRARGATQAGPERVCAEDGMLEGSYRRLACELLHDNNTGSGHLHAKAVGIVGCEAGMSRSEVAEQLAIEAAERGTDPVLLIDADERHRHVASRFGLNGSPGWREVLAGVADAESCVHSANSGRLAVMTPGEEHSLLEDVGYAPVGRVQLDELKNKYGLVVVDLPSVNELDTRASAGWLDETVLVVEAERTRIKSAQRTKALLERAGIHVTGVVLANRREYVPRWLYDRL